MNDPEVNFNENKNIDFVITDYHLNYPLPPALLIIDFDLNIFYSYLIVDVKYERHGFK